MDLSKLPKLSQTPAPPPTSDPEPTSPAPASPVMNYAADRRNKTSIGAEAWIRIAMGALTLLLTPRLIQYLLARKSFTWTFNDGSGAPMAYTQTVFFWQDLGLTVFGIMLIIEGMTLALARQRIVLAAVLGLTVLTTLLNLGVVIWTYPITGLPLMNVLAVGFGVYIAIYQWQAISSEA